MGGYSTPDSEVAKDLQSDCVKVYRYRNAVMYIQMIRTNT